MSEPIRVDVWSDVACPWCYIGKRKFERGVAAFAQAGGPDVQVEFRSFQLAPDTPVDFDGSEVDYLERRGYPRAQVDRMLATVTQAAAAIGLHYDFDALRPTNTAKAHQVLHLAKAQGVQSEMKERLLRAYFVEGGHIGHDDDLAELGAEVGLDRAGVLTALRDETYAPAVAADIDLARRYRIQSVPFFVIGATYGVPGARDPSFFEEVLSRYAEERAAADS